MAFVFKSPNSSNWIAGFRDVTGKRRNRSTGLLSTERNKRKAEAAAHEYEAAGRNKRAAQQVRRTICSLHKEFTGEDMPVMTLRLHVDQWLLSKKTSVSSHKVQRRCGWQTGWHKSPHGFTTNCSGVVDSGCGAIHGTKLE
jgi:hypothetical protein